MKKKRIVVKLGSSIIAPGGRIDKKFLKDISRQICRLMDNKVEVCLVSSGAIVAGMSNLGWGALPRKLSLLQASASVGQGDLINIYSSRFKKYGRLCGLILLTWDDFQRRERYINAKQTFNALFEQGVIPVVNENDTISTEEIRFGDNDELSAMVAGLIDADKLILLSDVEGFYFQGKLLDTVTSFSDGLFKEVKKKKLSFTRGGMDSKLKAVDKAVSCGIKAIIANGRNKDILLRMVLRKEKIGTLFVPKEKLPAKKRWIAYSRKAKGSLYVDRGAEKALLERLSSLLSQGIIKVEGDFLKNDTVTIFNDKNSILGWGLVSYESGFLKKNRGKKLSSEVIHRNHLVLRK